MPNWVMVNASISCDNVNALKEIKYRFFDDNGFFSLNLVKPIPNELNDVISNGFTYTYKRYWESSTEEQEKIEKEYDIAYSEQGAFKERLAQANLLHYKYGHIDWYTWRLDNWGTKWDCNNDYSWDIRQEPIVGHTMHFSFQTAWNMPHKVFLRLSELMPCAEITVNFADEDLGNNCGRRIYENGTYTADSSVEDNLQFACGVWGYDFDEINKNEEE